MNLGIRFGESYRIAYQKGNEPAESTSAGSHDRPSDFRTMILEQETVQNAVGNLLRRKAIPHEFKFVAHNGVDSLYLLTNGPEKFTLDRLNVIRNQVEPGRSERLRRKELPPLRKLQAMNTRIEQMMVRRGLVKATDPELVVHYRRDKQGNVILENKEALLQTLTGNSKSGQSGHSVDYSI